MHYCWNKTTLKIDGCFCFESNHQLSLSRSYLGCWIFSVFVTFFQHWWCFVFIRGTNSQAVPLDRHTMIYKRCLDFNLTGLPRTLAQLFRVFVLQLAETQYISIVYLSPPNISPAHLDYFLSERTELSLVQYVCRNAKPLSLTPYMPGPREVYSSTQF